MSAAYIQIHFILLFIMKAITMKLDTVKSEIFARILFSRIALKVIFATLKICDYDILYLHK